jgi:hypothetical protein
MWGRVGLPRAEGVPFRFSAPLPPFGAPSPAASHAGEGRNEQGGVVRVVALGEGFFSAPLPPLRGTLPRGESTRGREWAGHDAGKRVSWVGEDEVPPSRPFGAPSPAASHAGEGVSPESLRVGEGVVLSGAKVPPSRPFGAPSPAARAREGGSEPGKLRESESAGWARMKCPPPAPSGHPPPRQEHAGEGRGRASYGKASQLGGRG